MFLKIPKHGKFKKWYNIESMVFKEGRDEKSQKQEYQDEVRSSAKDVKWKCETAK